MRPEATRRLDQVWVNWMEHRLLRRWFRRQGAVGESLLDVPCGYGRFWRLFGELGLRPVGVDLDFDQAQEASRSDPARSRGRGGCGSVFHLPFDDNTFDWVFCVRLLHLNFSDDQRRQILRELARVTRRHVVASVYLFTPLHGVARLWNSTPGRVRLMGEEDLLYLADAAGLQLEAKQRLLPFIHMQTFTWFSKSPVRR